MLRHCAKCEMTTAHDADGCARCRFRKATRKTTRPMTDETKQRLRAIKEWREGKRATDPRTEEERMR